VLSHEYDLLINYISIIKLKEKFDIKAIFIVKKYAKWNSNVLLCLIPYISRTSTNILTRRNVVLLRSCLESLELIVS
jgi:hypothetical protein